MFRQWDMSPSGWNGEYFLMDTEFLMEIKRKPHV